MTTSSAPLDATACSLAMDAMHTALLPAIDAKHLAHKSALTARVNAMKSALALTDTTARKTAIKTAEEAFKTSMKTAEDAFKTAVKATTDAVRSACPGVGHPMMGGMMMDAPHMMKKEKKDSGRFGHIRSLMNGKKGGRGMPAMESTDDR